MPTEVRKLVIFLAELGCRCNDQPRGNISLSRPVYRVAQTIASRNRAGVRNWLMSLGEHCVVPNLKAHIHEAITFTTFQRPRLKAVIEQPNVREN